MWLWPLRAVHQRQGQAGPVVWSSAVDVGPLRHSQDWLAELLEAGCAQSQALWKVWGARVSAEIAGLSWLRVLVEEVREVGAWPTSRRPQTITANVGCFVF